MYPVSAGAVLQRRSVVIERNDLLEPRRDVIERRQDRGGAVPRRCPGQCRRERSDPSSTDDRKPGRMQPARARGRCRNGQESAPNARRHCRSRPDRRCDWRGVRVPPSPPRRTTARAGASTPSAASTARANLRSSRRRSDPPITRAPRRAPLRSDRRRSAGRRRPCAHSRAAPQAAPTVSPLAVKRKWPGSIMPMPAWTGPTGILMQAVAVHVLESHKQSGSRRAAGALAPSGALRSHWP